jgi:PAS domain S-box-containing protein
LQRLRVVGAERSSVTGDAAGEITKQSQHSLSRLVLVEIVLGVASVLLALAMAWLLRRAALRESARFRSLVYSSTDLITVLDRVGQVRYQSPSSARILERAADDLVGTKLSDLVHPDDREAFDGTLVSLLDCPGEKAELRFRVSRRDGEWRTMEGVATNLLGDRNVRGVVVNSRDVTEREQAAIDLATARDRALTASKTKSQFLASMSHEIRTPMNAIIGLNGLLIDTDLDVEQQEFARGVQTSADGLLSIINDILDFSKVEAGKLELELVDFDLGLLIEDVTTMLADVAHGKGVELLAHFPPELPPAVRGDPTRVRQILLNLASNAVKFTAAGEVVVRARMLGDAGDHMRIGFEVSDTGVGIVPEDLERLFEPFSQADSSTTRRYGGTGLGLAIVKQLVELMQGSIGAQSELGVGSTFWFELPFDRHVAARPARVGLEKLVDLRTLIVDDNATNRLILREQLRSWGMLADDTDHAEPALELLRAAARAGTPYDVVLLDLNMPDIDGLQLARTISADATLRSARTFLLSSSGRVPPDEAAAVGLAATLTKPVRTSELFNCLVGGLTMGASPSGENAAPVSNERPRRGRLLLVEDNPTNQLVATHMLAKIGYEVDVAANGREGVEASAHSEYGAILMDCQMPEMDGYQATGAIRRREGLARHTPIIAMTAAAMDGDREVCLAAGMDDYISKPVRSDALIEILDRWIVADDPTVTAIDPAVLDPGRFDTLLELDDGDGAILREVTAAFLADAVSQLDHLREAAAEGDPEVLEQSAHALKGASASIGAVTLAARCAALEELARGRVLAEARTIVEQLDAEFDRVRDALMSAMPAR